MPPEINPEKNAPSQVTSPGGTVETGINPIPAAPDVTEEEIKAFQAANPGVAEDAAIGSILTQKKNLGAGATPAVAGTDLSQLRDVMSDPQARSYDVFQKISTAAQADPEILNQPERLREIYSQASLMGSRPEMALLPDDATAEDRSAIGQYMTAIGREIQRMNDPAYQQKSFVNTFDELRKQADAAGQSLEDVDTRLLDIDKIMRGTKDDIRNELQNAGGLVTASAVEYLATVRNKVLVGEAERLQNIKDQKEKYIDRMLTLGKMDREEADKRFERAFDLAGKAADLELKLEETGAKRSKEYMDFLERQQDNARQRVNMLISSGGLRNLSDDQLAALEVDGGFVPGDLTGVREALLEERADDVAKLEIATDRLNLAIERANNTGNGSSESVNDVNAQLKNFAVMKSGGQSVPAWAEQYLVEKKKDGVGTGEYEALAVSKGSLASVQGNRDRALAEEAAATQQDLNNVDFIQEAILQARQNGKGWQDIREAALEDGVPMNVYQQAVRRILTSEPIAVRL